MSGHSLTLLFRDVPAVYSRHLVTSPHFSKRIILESDVVRGNSWNVSVFFTDLSRDSRTGDPETCHSLTLRHVEGPALALLYLIALDVADDVVDGLTETLRLTAVLYLLRPAVLGVLSLTDLVMDRGADFLLEKI